MKIIGLSGGIASGKNLVAEILKRKLNAEIFDADKETHKILESDKTAVSRVSQHFSQAVIDGKVDRKILGEIVFANRKKLKILEEIIHKKIRQKYQEFIAKNKAEFVVLNIPLLLETSIYKCDYIIAVVAPLAIRKMRFINREIAARKSDSKENLAKKFEKIVKHQMVDKDRIAKANFVVNSNCLESEIISQVENIIKNLN
ncbi:MAG TPA: dephospho-CoA kinase [Rickettsiales bacterium]|nr:dephospho-CoA kinase [Rickettsiales bacterium]